MNEVVSIKAKGPNGAWVLPLSGWHRTRGFLGLVMLDTRFPRPLGDGGNPDSFGVPVRRALLLGAHPNAVVCRAAELQASGLAQEFVALARELAAAGASAITTSCGFLVLFQQEVQAEVSVPVVTSSLLWLPQLLVTQAQVGVLTISAQNLSHEHLLAAGVPPARLPDVLVQGVDPKGSFAQAILGNHVTMDLGLAASEVVAAALLLKARAPGMTTLVLECTNMPPYAAQIAHKTGLHVLSILDAFGA